MQRLGRLPLLLAGRHRFASAGMPSGANSSTIVSRMDSRPAKASDSSQTAHESGSPRAEAPPNCSRFSQITAVGRDGGPDDVRVFRLLRASPSSCCILLRR